MGLKQQTHSSCIVLLIVMGVSFGNAVASTVCDNEVCSCSPRVRNFTMIECKCNAIKKGFNFTASDFSWEFHNVREFYLSDCDDSVTFTTNSFKSLSQLENLYIDRVGKVDFQSGVFQRLSSLSLQNIRELEFGERAFMGVRDLVSIDIHGATVPRLHSHALFDIRGLRSLEMSDVVIHRVEKDAVNIELRLRDSQVLIKNCTIGNIESNGIVLKAENVSVVKSVLDKVSPNAINVTSADLLLISESDFRNNLTSSAINMVAHVITISNNIFKLIPSGVMRNIKYDDIELIFTNNTVHSIQIEDSLDRTISSIKTAEISGNHLPCTCILSMIHHDLPDFGRNNFCTTKCNISFADFGELIKAGKFCILNNSEDPDEDELCRSVTYSTPRSPPSYFSTHGPSSTAATTNKPGNSSGGKQLAPALFFFALYIVVFSS